MTEDFIVGMIAGGGWGLFFGGIFGAAWAFRVIKEFAGDEETESDSS